MSKHGPFRVIPPNPAAEPDETFDESQDPLFGSTEQAEGRIDTTSYYALLNVPTDASPSTINASFRSLALVLHPDKQRSEESRLAAQKAFARVGRAYQVLTNPKLRAIYDTLGEEGLKDGVGLEVGKKGKSAEELKQEFEYKAEEKKQLMQHRLINPKGDITCKIDASSLLAHKEEFVNGNDSIVDRVHYVQATNYNISHSFDTALSPDTTFKLRSNMASRFPRVRTQSRFGGNLTGTLATSWSPTLMTEPKDLLGAVYVIDDETSVNLYSQAPSLLCPPTIGLTLTRLLTPSLRTSMTYQSGFYTIGSWGLPFVGRRQDQSSLTLSLTNKIDSQLSGWAGELEVGSSDIRIGLDWCTKMLQSVEFKLGGGIGVSSGTTVVLQAARKVTAWTKMTVSVEGALDGITLKIKLFRLGQRLTLPIQIAQSLDPQILLAAMLIPSASYLAAHYGYIMPEKRRGQRRRWKQIQEENRELLVGLQQEAADAVRILEPIAEKKLEAERARNGLIVESAVYGSKARLGSSSARSEPCPDSLDTSVLPTSIDVRIPLQALSTEGQLIIPGGRTKSSILGFFDCALKEEKVLSVRYTFGGLPHAIVVGDEDALCIPLREHALD